MELNQAADGRGGRTRDVRQCRRESQRLLLVMMMMMTSMVMMMMMMMVMIMMMRRRQRHRCERMLLLKIGALRGGKARGRTQKAARECYFIMRGLRTGANARVIRQSSSILRRR